MKIDNKILDSLLDLLIEGKDINIHSLSKRGGFDRSSLYYRINKRKLCVSGVPQ